MKITLDSTEPLADVLRVVGSMYGVTLTTATAAPAEGGQDTTTNPGPPIRVAARRPTRRNTPKQRASAGKGQGLDARVVRQWAWENGYDVNTRGSLSSAVRDAYLAANPS